MQKQYVKTRLKPDKALYGFYNALYGLTRPYMKPHKAPYTARTPRRRPAVRPRPYKGLIKAL